jgi:hypothetical protein
VAPSLGGTFWPETTFLLGATRSLGRRKYAEADPLFGRRREDEKTRVEGFFDYQETNPSVVIE